MYVNSDDMDVEAWVSEGDRFGDTRVLLLDMSGEPTYRIVIDSDNILDDSVNEDRDDEGAERDTEIPTGNEYVS